MTLSLKYFPIFSHIFNFSISDNSKNELLCWFSYRYKRNIVNFFQIRGENSDKKIPKQTFSDLIYCCHVVSLTVFFPAIWHPLIKRSEGGGYDSPNVFHVIWHLGSFLPTPYLRYASRCSMRNILVLCEIFLFSAKYFSSLWNIFVYLYSEILMLIWEFGWTKTNHSEWKSAEICLWKDGI